jgi:hypothetical protein
MSQASRVETGITWPREVARFRGSEIARCRHLGASDLGSLNSECLVLV